MRRAHLARRSAVLGGLLALGLAVGGLGAAPVHAQYGTDTQYGAGCVVLGGYLATTGVYFDFPYVGGTVSGYGFGHGYPFYSTPYPIWGGGFGYVPYQYYPAVGTPAAGVAPGFLLPINAYNGVPGPIGPVLPAGLPYYAGSPFPPSYPWSTYPQVGVQPIGAFTGFWDPFYVGRGAGQASQFGVGC
ncbi:MAG: hypothetical protein IRZ14_04205 [Chloroflexi bacterium]|nr:hypothetical protein [Chloroflexota bacterium]